MARDIVMNPRSVRRQGRRVRLPAKRDLFGGIALAFAIVSACASVTAPAHAQAKKESRSAAKAKAPVAPVPADIDRNGVLILIRSTLLALDQANKTGNYTVLRDLGAPGFQSNTDAKLAEVFASQRSEGLDLNGVAVLEPQLTMLPQIETNGMLHMGGFFPSVPMQVNFELLFAPSQGQWKVFGVAVNLVKGSPQAPDAPAAAKGYLPAKPEPSPLPPTVSVDVKNRQKK